MPEGYNAGGAECVRTISELVRAMERGSVLEGTVVRCDSADMSLHVDIGGMHGIIPREEAAYSTSGEVRDIAIITRVGKRVAFTVKEIEHKGGAVLAHLSRRDVQKLCMEQYISHLTPGDVIPVRVTHLEPFGAFVDIGAGIVSLASVDTLSVSRISHPSDRLSVGECGYAVVRSIDRECGRIYMSLRELYGTRCTVNSAHHQAVWRLGTGLQVFACAEDGTVEAVGHRTLPVFAVQWHPERLCGAFARPESADGARLLRALLR